MFRKFRAYMDLGRAQGFAVTSAVALTGALTSTGYLDLYTSIKLIIVSIIGHAIPNAWIETNDYELDKQIPESKMKPIVSGIISKRESYEFVVLGTIVLFTLVVYFFQDKPIAVIFFGISYLSVMWYGTYHGKRTLFSYDFAFCFTYAFYVLFGAYAIGNPTIYTWIFIGITTTGGTAFAQWENSLKDVDFDKSVGVRSFAVYSGIDSKKKLSWKHPFVLYGVGIKAVLLFFCFYSFYVMWKFPEINANYFENYIGFLNPPYENYSFAYLIFILTFGIGSQFFLLWRFVNKRERLEHRKTILLDVGLTAITGFSVIIGYVGFVVYAIVILFIIIGYFVGSALQYGTEFKYGRYKNWEKEKRKKSEI